jgi:divalent metal cation (Fe/Co/Zn/Cd) transporter
MKTLKEIITQGIGQASAVFMIKNPDTVMPTEELSAIADEMEKAIVEYIDRQEELKTDWRN